MFNPPKLPAREWRPTPEEAHRDKAAVRKQRGVIDEFFAWALARLRTPAQSEEDAREEARIMKAVSDPTLSVLPNEVKDKILFMVQTLDDRDPPRCIATLEEHVRDRIKPGDNLVTIKEYIKNEILALQTEVSAYLSELEASGRCLESTASSTLNSSLAELRAVPPSRSPSAGLTATTAMAASNQSLLRLPSAGLAAGAAAAASSSRPPSRPPSAGPAAGTRSQPSLSFSEFDPELELDELVLETADLVNVDLEASQNIDIS